MDCWYLGIVYGCDTLKKETKKMCKVFNDKYFFMVYKVHPYMCRDWYVKTLCVKGSPVDALSEIRKDCFGEISHDSYSLIDYVEISKEEFDNWYKIKKMNKTLDIQDGEIE